MYTDTIRLFALICRGKILRGPKMENKNDFRRYIVLYNTLTRIYCTKQVNDLVLYYIIVVNIQTTSCIQTNNR